MTIWWRHQIETFSALLALCAGNSPVTGEFPSQTPVTRSFDVFIDLCVNKRLSKNGVAGDLRRHRAHYDVTVMKILDLCQTPQILYDGVGRCIYFYIQHVRSHRQAQRWRSSVLYDIFFYLIQNGCAHAVWVSTHWFCTKNDDDNKNQSSRQRFDTLWNSCGVTMMQCADW